MEPCALPIRWCVWFDNLDCGFYRMVEFSHRIKSRVIAFIFRVDHMFIKIGWIGIELNLKIGLLSFGLSYSPPLGTNNSEFLLVLFLV